MITPPLGHICDGSRSHERQSDEYANRCTPAIEMFYNPKRKSCHPSTSSDSRKSNPRASKKLGVIQSEAPLIIRTVLDAMKDKVGLEHVTVRIESKKMRSEEALPYIEDDRCSGSRMRSLQLQS